MRLARSLALALFGLAATYAAWFWNDRHALAALLVFGLPPLLLGVIAWRGWARAGLMVAWTRPPERTFAFFEILFTLAIIGFASMPGLRARFHKPR
jgi:hypothetical protein